MPAGFRYGRRDLLLQLALLLGTGDALFLNKAVASLRSSNDLLRAQLTKELGLVAEDVLTSTAEEGGSEATVRTFTTPTTVSWMSFLDVATVDGGCESSFSAFCGPMIDPPHIVARIGVAPKDNTIRVLIDYIPRAYSGYDQIQEDGTFPVPNSRQAFEQQGLRNAFAERWFTAQASDELAALRALEIKTTPLTLNAALEDGALKFAESSLGVDLVLPLSDDTLAAAIAARDAVSERWAQAWVTAASPVNQVPSMLMFAYDCETRPRCAARALGRLNDLFGDMAGAKEEFISQISTLDAGPSDQRDRSSSMQLSAVANFEEEGLGEMRHME
mmetsp:Transcript_6846/g.12712  ORF Transcript_6846/g.12712 Transcript_6846/m.12712 type:complete len:331 (+) Transcript_6846:45-1037(+)